MRYDTIEAQICEAVKELRDSDGNPLFAHVAPYEYQFEAPFNLPEDFLPEKAPYCYVYISEEDEKGSPAGKSPAGKIVIASRMVAVLIMGHHSNDVRKNKAKVYERLQVVRENLHFRSIYSGNDVLNISYLNTRIAFATKGHLAMSLSLSMNLHEEF